jgi:hypothetical protein
VLSLGLAMLSQKDIEILKSEFASLRDILNKRFVVLEKSMDERFDNLEGLISENRYNLGTVQDLAVETLNYIKTEVEVRLGRMNEDVNEKIKGNGREIRKILDRMGVPDKGMEGLDERIRENGKLIEKINKEMKGYFKIR